LNIREGKRCSIGAVAGIFARAEEEEEGRTNHVGDGHVGGGGGEGSNGQEMVEDGDGNGFDTIRRGVGTLVALELAFDAKINFPGWS
jgi:hypothetical protein